MLEKVPLVSVVVITYNSSKYILETLESIKQQTYKNLELIITDDCSKDNTVALCQDWLDVNKHGFIRTKLITISHNTGVSANCNRGYQEAQGEWIKCIAGDDCLCLDGIEKYLNFVSLHQDALICHSNVLVFKNEFREENMMKNIFYIPKVFQKNIDSHKQFLILCLSNVIAAPSVFMNKALFKKMGGFDEEISMCEDWPMWLKITRQGYPFFYLNDYTVKYRMHSASTVGNETVNFLFKRFFGANLIVYKKYIRFQAPKFIAFMQKYDYCIRKFLDRVNCNKKGFWYAFIYKLLDAPFLIVYKLMVK